MAEEERELEALRAKNRLLARQVIESSKLEQRLIGAQREADAQLLRTEAFSRFASAVAAVGAVGAVLEHGLALILEVFPYEQGAGFARGDDGAFVLAAVKAAPGCEEDSVAAFARRRWVAPAPAKLPPDPIELSDEEVVAGAPDIGALLACLEEVFTPRIARPSPTGDLLVLPVRRSEEVVALLLLRKLPTQLSHMERLADERDRSFLRLVASHLQVALDRVTLVIARRDAEAELERSEARMRAILEHLPAGVLLTRDERVVYCNAGLTRTLGEPLEALVGRPVSELIHRDERAAAAALRAAPGEGATRVLERRMLRADGQVVVVMETTLALALDGQPATLSILQDLTEQRAMRTQLLQAERLAAVGMLAAGVAHEINNPLAYVVLHIERLAEALAGSEAEDARTALEGALRIRGIVRDLKTFSRAGDEDSDRVDAIDVAQVLHSVMAMASNELRHRARVTADLPAGHTVKASAGRLGQVFLNLLVNAAQAIPAGAVERHLVTVSISRAEGDVIIAISDTGLGIAPSDLARVFDPFFTTKQVGLGLGLGLAISRNVIEGFGGRIEVESTVGHGTRFVVRLPACASAPRAATALLPGAVPSGLRVLAIDDEPAILLVLVRLLRTCEVVTVSSGEDACKLLEADQRFDVILCDLTMPAGGGDYVHAWLAEHRPALIPRLMFMTGGTFSPDTQEFVVRSGRQVLHKPFTSQQLGSLMAAVAAAS